MVVEPGATKVLLPADVARFCSQNNLDNDLSNAIRLAYASFAGISSLTAELEIDPDTVEERIILHLNVSVAVEDVVRSRKTFTRKWVESALPAVREKIVLLYHIAT